MTKTFLLIILSLGLLNACGGDDDEDGDASELCDRELCQSSETLRNECLDIVEVCLDEPDANRDECAIIAGEKCDGG